MKYLKIKLITIALIAVLFSTYQSKAQSSITIDASQNITNFKFTNSDGVRDEGYLPNYSGSYALGYKYEFDFGLIISPRIGMRKAGATYIYDETNYSWDFQYADFKLGLGYQYNFDKLGVYFNASPYFGFLLKANQRQAEQDFDIIESESESLSRTDYGVFLTPGAIFKASDYISVYGEFNYMLGLANLETNTDQTSNNVLFGFSLGLAFHIK